MRNALVALLCFVHAAVAQIAVDPVRYPEVERLLTPIRGEQHFACDVHAFKPSLGFTFRFQATYIMRVPMRQFFGSGHKWLVLTKVTPEDEGHAPLYLAESLLLPDVPKTDITLEVGGTFLTGEGRYSVQSALIDETHRVCRSSWRIEAKLRKEDRSVTVAIAPNTAQGLSFRGWTPVDKRDEDVRKLHLTVFLHAAPMFARSNRLRSYDRGLWLGSLVSLLDTLQPESVRLVVFNLDQQKELYRTDRFKPEQLQQVAAAMNSIQLGLVDYSVLQRPKGHVDVLADLVNQELRANHPADAAVFLGPTARFSDKVPESALEEHNGDKPHFFYFQYKPYWGRAADFPDSIVHAVKRLKGKTIVIHSPGEFARAIEQVRELQ